MSRIDNTVEYTYGVYQSTMKTLIEGAVLAIIVVLIFLRDMRATIVAAIALPLVHHSGLLGHGGDGLLARTS